MNTQSSPSVNQPDAYPENFQNLKLEDEDDDYAYDSDYDDDYDQCDDDDLEIVASRLREKSDKIVNEFLQQVAENRFFEFSWPPDPDCPSYKAGYIRDYVKDLKFVDQSETATKFVGQIRRSWGYDIDCVPPGFLCSRLRRIDFHSELHNLLYFNTMMSAAKLVIDRINTQAAEKMGKTFEQVQVNKAVVGGYALYLLSLIIKEVEADSKMYVRAAVSSSPGHDLELEDCKLVSSLSTT